MQVTNWTFDKRNTRGTDKMCSLINNRECTTYKYGCTHGKKSLYKPRKVFPTLTDLKSHFQITKTMIKGNCNIVVTEEIEPQEKRVLF